MRSRSAAGGRPSAAMRRRSSAGGRPSAATRRRSAATGCVLATARCSPRAQRRRSRSRRRWPS
jgi:hypothetical protein